MNFCLQHYKYYIDLFNALYQLKTENEEELNSIYNKLKTEMIDSKKHHPQNILEDILNIIPFNIRYKKSYLTLAKLISDDYHITEANNIPFTSNYLFYKEYGIKLFLSQSFGYLTSENLNIHLEDTIYRAIMFNDIERFISSTETEEFNPDQKCECSLYPKLKFSYSFEHNSLLELCCYHGAVDCFKLLRSKFNSEITYEYLCFSFLGGNPEIISECLKYQDPGNECMRYAIISHNIDFVTFLMNEYDLEINLEFCGIYKNLETFLVYFDQTNDFNKCFVYSAIFAIPSLCEYFAANVNKIDNFVDMALLYATLKYSREIVELLLSHGAKVDIQNDNGENALRFATRNNDKEIVEFLIAHGANINEIYVDGNTALHYAAKLNKKEIAELLISHGANINEKDKDGLTALHIAAVLNRKETAELLILHGANINEKDIDKKTALHITAELNRKETAELLISRGANINEKDINGRTALHYAAIHNKYEIAELLISHGANINERDKYGKTALHIAADYNSKETTECLISYGANINEKDNGGKNALDYARKYNNKEIIELFIAHGAN